MVIPITLATGTLLLVLELRRRNRDTPQGPFAWMRPTSTHPFVQELEKATLEFLRPFVCVAAIAAVVSGWILFAPTGSITKGSLLQIERFALAARTMLGAFSLSPLASLFLLAFMYAAVLLLAPPTSRIPKLYAGYRKVLAHIKAIVAAATFFTFFGNGAGELELRAQGLINRIDDDYRTYGRVVESSIQKAAVLETVATAAETLRPLITPLLDSLVEIDDDRAQLQSIGHAIGRLGTVSFDRLKSIIPNEPLGYDHRPLGYQRTTADPALLAEALGAEARTASTNAGLRPVAPSSTSLNEIRTAAASAADAVEVTATRAFEALHATRIQAATELTRAVVTTPLKESSRVLSAEIAPLGPVADVFVKIVSDAVQKLVGRWSDRFVNDFLSANRPPSTAAREQVIVEARRLSTDLSSSSIAIARELHRDLDALVREESIARERLAKEIHERLRNRARTQLAALRAPPSPRRAKFDFSLDPYEHLCTAQSRSRACVHRRARAKRLETFLADNQPLDVKGRIDASRELLELLQHDDAERYAAELPGIRPRFSRPGAPTEVPVRPRPATHPRGRPGAWIPVEAETGILKIAVRFFSRGKIRW